MKKKKIATITLRDLSPEQILQVVKSIDGDGHAMFKETILEKAGWPPALISQYAETMESDFSSPKSTLFDNHGRPTNQIRGVYGLSLLASICREYDIQYEGKMGRGWQAREYDRAIRAFFAEKAVEA